MGSFDRIIGRLHRVFNKDPQSVAAVIIINNSAYRVTLNIKQGSMTVVNGHQKEKQLIPITPETTLADLFGAISTAGINVTYAAPAFESRLAISLTDEFMQLEPDASDIYIIEEDGVEAIMKEDGTPILRES